MRLVAQLSTAMVGVTLLWYIASPRRVAMKWQRYLMAKPARWLHRTERQMRKDRRDQFDRYRHRTKLFGSNSERWALRWAVNIHNGYIAEVNQRIRRERVVLRILIVAGVALNIYLWVIR